MLLLDLIDDDVFTSGFSEFIVEYGSRDGCEEKHVKENEDYEKDGVRLVVFDGGELVIGVIVVGSQCIDLKHHFP